MTLFLTSSPCIQGADRAILNPANGFVDYLRSVLPDQPDCLFVCSSPDTPDKTDHFARDMQDAFVEAGMPFGTLNVLDCRTAAAAGELVDSSDLIILAGGHVPTQNAFFHRIALAEHLRRFTGTVMGISAGTMNAATLVYAQPELRGEAVDPYYRRFLPGLGLTDVQILPHYQMVKDDWLDGKRLFEDITYPDSMGRVFYALPDGSYLLRQKGEEMLMGECWAIHNGRMEKIAGEGECTKL